MAGTPNERHGVPHNPFLRPYLLQHPIMGAGPIHDAIML